MPLGFIVAAMLGLAAPAPVEVMVLGVYHFANPGQDLNNPKVDDVRTPRRQRELAALADSLATFRPTRVAVEQQAAAPDFSLPAYASFGPGDVTANASETVQIGFRLAHKLGHAAVYGFDEQPKPGEPDYFPFDRVRRYAAAHGETAYLQSLFAPVQARIAFFESQQAQLHIAEMLARENDSSTIEALHSGSYYGLLRLGDGDSQPGAELNAMWYLRNAKMFAKLQNIAKPGDRILVIVGSGHLYWLRHFATTTPGYRLVDPLPYLRSTAR